MTRGSTLKTFTTAFGLLGGLLFSAPDALWAQTSDVSCRPVNGPAATLFFPYFEVDLDDPAGGATLLSISNTSEEPVIAQVVAWSDLARPVLDFTVYLPGSGVRSLNMADVIVSGQLPATWPGSAALEQNGGPLPVSCSEEILSPTLGAQELEVLHARLSGRPDPNDGTCYAKPTAGSTLVGYVTVDVLNECSEVIRTPIDPGYFESGGQGLASNANVLTGDFFLLDSRSDSAQGLEAVALVADAGRTTDRFLPSFYNRGDDRLPVGTRYRTRILQGGGFSGGTELLIWAFGEPGFISATGYAAASCEEPGGIGRLRIEYAIRDEQGQIESTDRILPAGIVSRWQLGEDLAFKAGFGSIELDFFADCGICSPPSIPIQAWVMPIYHGAGRFSAGLHATQLDDVCD